MQPLRIATCRPLPEPDPDEQLLMSACHAAGIAARMVAWNDSVLWQQDQPDSCTPVLIRSTWDYIHHLPEFDFWLQRLARQAPVWNPLSVVRSNLHKRYLLDLTEECVPTVPTKLIPRGSKESLKEWLSLSGWSDVVIKPAVGAGSFDTHRLAVCDDLAQRQWQTSIDARDMLIQPYLPAVEDEGERALVWIAGEFTHAVRKTARFSADIEQVSAALPISTAERVLGESALRAALSMADDSLDSLLYARVDVARDTEGEWRVMELELIEPSLFLAQHPPALQRLIAALQYRLGITREA